MKYGDFTNALNGDDCSEEQQETRSLDDNQEFNISDIDDDDNDARNCLISKSLKSDRKSFTNALISGKTCGDLARSMYGRHRNIIESDSSDEESDLFNF